MTTLFLKEPFAAAFGNNFQVSKGEQTAGWSPLNGGEKQLNPPPRCALYMLSLGILLLRPVECGIFSVFFLPLQPGRTVAHLSDSNPGFSTLVSFSEVA